MNYSANLSEQQSQFLDAMATQFNFGSDTLTVFLNRFDKANRNQDNSLLAIKITWSREPEDKSQKFQDELTKICRVFEGAGCPIEKPKRGRQRKGKSPWEQAFKWLWEIKFIEWQESQKELAQPVDINALVNQVRKKVSADIQKRCGWMRVLDMTHPIGLNDIYTDVNILEKITGRRRLEIAQLLENCNTEEFERFGLNQVVEKRVPGLDAVEQYSKLMILGKPGAGKTTFLKRIAIQCNNGQFFADRVPIFITVKDFAEAPQQPGLLQYINDQFVINDISDQEIIKTLLLQGRIIVLLDGLDEVKQADNDRVLREIRNFSTQYDANSVVITCRIASQEYTFEQFTEVEVADFDDKQIAEFATKWFQTKNLEKTKNFIQKLKENQRIKELASNPLLLGLLCLLFEERTNLSSNRADLYKEWVEILLRRWDGTRSIKRDPIETELNKKDLLSMIALKTFEKENYFFTENQVVKYISDYIQKLPEAKTDPEEVSKAVLKSIEAQYGLLVERARGIYSFSHLSFHEFFTARNIALSRNSPQTFQQLVSHITDKRWREVFLLTLGILKDADNLLLLMKHQIDGLLRTDEKLQEFLTWVSLKSSSVKAFYKKAAIRVCYFTLALDLAFDFNLALDLDRALSYALTFDLALEPDLGLDRALAFALDRALDRYLDLDRALDLTYGYDSHFGRKFFLGRALDLDRALALDLELTFDFNLDHALDHNTNLQSQIQKLKQELPDISEENLEQFNHWWKTNSQAWTEQLRNVIIQHRNIGHNQQLSKSQLQLLQQYYDANKLLIVQKLKQELPDISEENLEQFNQWWKTNGQAWTEQLRNVMIQHRNIGHDWQFNEEQRQVLQQYYDANKLLVDCLNSECYVSRSVRQEIEDTLLLPVNRI